MFQDKNCGWVSSRSFCWNCLGMWRKEAYVVLLCASLCLLLPFLHNFFTLLPVSTSFSKGMEASKCSASINSVRMGWDRSACTGSEQMSSKLPLMMARSKGLWRLPKNRASKDWWYFPIFWLSHYGLLAPDWQQALFQVALWDIILLCESHVGFSFYRISSTLMNVIHYTLCVL